MSINLDRLEHVAKPCSKEAIATARFRRENREWLKNVSRNRLVLTLPFTNKRNVTKGFSR